MLNNKNEELYKIFNKRCPPIILEIFGYISGFLIILFNNKLFIIIYGSIFLFYYLCNLFFDIFTVSISYKNNKMPLYKDITYYEMLMLSNKKYRLNKDTKYDFTLNNFNYYYINNSNLELDIHIYVGDNILVNNILYYIYLFGITRKNFSLKEHTNFIHNEIIFV
jgi:hypothetical protein